jgi:hypothetical protein
MKPKIRMRKPSKAKSAAKTAASFGPNMMMVQGKAMMQQAIGKKPKMR